MTTVQQEAYFTPEKNLAKRGAENHNDVTAFNGPHPNLGGDGTYYINNITNNIIVDKQGDSKSRV